MYGAFILSWEKNRHSADAYNHKNVKYLLTGKEVMRLLHMPIPNLGSGMGMLVTEAAREYDCNPEDIRLKLEYPEQIDW